MTDREALAALATPEPEIRWDSPDRSNTESLNAWDAWNRTRIAALEHARGLTTEGAD